MLQTKDLQNVHIHGLGKQVMISTHCLLFECYVFADTHILYVVQAVLAKFDNCKRTGSFMLPQQPSIWAELLYLQCGPQLLIRRHEMDTQHL